MLAVGPLLITPSIKDMKFETTRKPDMNKPNTKYSTTGGDSSEESNSIFTNQTNLNNDFLNDISTREWSILSENINLDILPLEQDPNTQSMKSKSKNENISEYMKRHHKVIGCITVITISAILDVILILLTLPLLKTCRHQQPTPNDEELSQAFPSTDGEPSTHEPSLYLLPEPQLFPSEAFTYRGEHYFKENNSILGVFIKTPLHSKCIKTLHPNAFVPGRIHSELEPEFTSSGERTNRFIFGHR